MQTGAGPDKTSPERVPGELQRDPDGERGDLKQGAADAWNSDDLTSPACEDDCHSEVPDGELLDALSEGTVGLSFLEKVILCLIDGHPLDGGEAKQERGQRLKQVMYAIDKDYHGHNKKGADDRRLLLWMTLQWCRQSGRPPWQLPSAPLGGSVFHYGNVEFESLTDLARKALQFFAVDLGGTEESQIRRLTGKFRKELNKNIRDLQNSSSNPHIIEHQMLLRMQDMFRKAGVPFQAPPEPSAF